MSKKIVKYALFAIVAFMLIGGGVAAFMFFAPHRNIANTSSDFQISAADLVDEYLNAYQASNEKYLDSEGESKIFEITGTIHSISTDYNDQTVILLKDVNELAGVSCTFDENSKPYLNGMEPGLIITAKGVIRSGARYDEDLEFYEDVVLEKCSLIENKSNL